MWKLLLTIALAHCSSARQFNNPILDNADYPDPGTIKYNGTYYIITTTNNQESNKFPIHTSRDLETWTLAGYALTADNLPVWSNKDAEYWAPEIHKVSDGFRLYFTSRDLVVIKNLTIGAASAPTPLGPWKVLDRPIVNGVAIDSTLINDNGTLYLVWRSKEDNVIKARPMNPDGLTFVENSVTTDLFTNDLPWEDELVEGPWYLRHGKYHYIFYSGHSMCSEFYRVGVARSLHPLGPYEKRGDPILASNDAFQGPGHNSMVKDLDDESDLMVFHAWKTNQVCGSFPRLTLLASVGWGEDDWPYVYDF